MTNKMFSVAIITYNQEKYISQTLDSILNQEHDYSYEIVIGEDCSTDNTKKVIEEYVQKYPQIIKPLYNVKNKGIINNYYNVIEHCSGKYIMECAGDDYWLPGKMPENLISPYWYAQIRLADGSLSNNKSTGKESRTEAEKVVMEWVVKGECPKRVSKKM